MSRRKTAEKRIVLPDAKYKSVIVAKFINYAMRCGNKSAAEKAVYSALDWVAEKLALPPVEILEAAIAKVRPLVEVRSRRVGGATYQVPCDIRAQRSLALGMRWLIGAARNRKDRKTFYDRLAMELFDANSDKGEAVNKRKNTHNMAEANRAFVHYNW